MKTYVDFKLEKNLSSELLNMDKTYDFVIKPLKNDLLETTVSIFFSQNWDIHNQNSQFKRFEKNLSSAFVDDERPQINSIACLRFVFVLIS